MAQSGGIGTGTNSIPRSAMIHGLNVVAEEASRRHGDALEHPTGPVVNAANATICKPKRAPGIFKARRGGRAPVMNPRTGAGHLPAW
jgi:hypothetical protein